MLEISDRQVLFGTRHRRMIEVLDDERGWSLEYCHGDFLFTAYLQEEDRVWQDTVELPEEVGRKLYEAMREYYGDA